MKIDTAILQQEDVLPFDTRGSFTADGWRPSVIGIYQGEVAVGMNVGANSLSKGNVGVFSRSGQREGIVPERDLGTPTAAQRAEAKRLCRCTIKRTS